MLKRESLAGDDLPNHLPQNLTIATSGASGAIFLKHLLLAVVRDQRLATVNFIASDSALRVMAEELGLKGRSNLIGQILGSSGGRASRKIQSISRPIAMANRRTSSVGGVCVCVS